MRRLIVSTFFIFLVLNTGYADPLFDEYDDNCPQLSGRTQWQQLMEFWRENMNKEPWLSDEELIEQADTQFLQNIAWPDKPDVTNVKFRLAHRMTISNNVNIVKIIINEINNGAMTKGGSAFKIDVISPISKASCPYRDYFNGTYLACCTLSNQYSTVTVNHQYFNFTAYEMFLGAGDFITTDPRRVNTLIWEKVISLPQAVDFLHDEKDKCKNSSVYTHDGTWMFVNNAYWKWVSEGCSFQFTPVEKLRECFKNNYNNRFIAIGETHVRDVFFYLSNTLDESFKHMEKIHNDLRWNQFFFRWETSFFVLEKHLTYILMDLATGKQAPPLIIISIGEWPIVSRPIGDYLLSMDGIISILKTIQRYGSKVIWQEMIAVKHKDAMNRPSNYLIGAMNYYICSRLAKADIPCVPYWKYTMPWADDLLCPGNTHTMCYEKGYLEVLPPGHMASQYLLQVACGY